MTRAAAALIASLTLLATASAAQAEVQAGAAAVDGTYNVGSSAGQYASTRDEGWGEYDPHFQSVKNQPSYGVQSRESVRALVIKGADGRYAAMVTNDHYIPQDSLWRRTAQLASAATGGALNETNITMSVSHNHSAPSYSSLNPGVWTFQDAFDYRFFDYYAKRNAEALAKAFADLHPVRVSATSSYFDKTQRNPIGAGRSDDGTPAGFTDSYVDHDLSVVRFEQTDGTPVATIVNLAQHPEMLEGYDLISAEFPGVVRRLVDRAAGGVTLFTQGSTGNGEIERETYHPVEDRANFDHTQYQQMEWAGRLIADGVLADIADIDAQTPNSDLRRRFGMASHAERFVPWMTDFPVAVEDRWFPGPVSHPLPGANNCRNDKALEGNPRVGTAADCSEVPIAETAGLPTALTSDDLQALGVPFPDNVSTPSFGLLEPTLGVHMQAIRLGEILFTVCSCEQWTDQSHNIKTRLDKIAGNEWLGWDPTDVPDSADDPRAASNRCAPSGDGTWTCSTSGGDPVAGDLIERMKARTVNDAAGWDDPACTDMGCGLQAEAEPNDVTKIRGNYTHDDTTVGGGTAQSEHYANEYGYDMVIAMSMANDYNGYIATYRDYMTHDHYRKALTGWGPHSSDFFATRLVRMGHTLKGDAESRGLIDRETDPAVAATTAPGFAPGALREIADQRAADAQVRAIGEVASAAVTAYDATVPDDGAGTEADTVQPKDIERFDAATFTWVGGNNFTDNPTVVVERKTGSGWETFADQSGEVPVTLDYPGADPTSAITYRTGGQVWKWTATFEAFVSRFDLVDPQGRTYRATPAGTYRFRVTGERREGGADKGYELTSDEFEVAPWSGITVENVQREGNELRFEAGPRSTITEPRVRKTSTRDFGALPFTIGPVDFPDVASDQAATGARFLNAQRGYSTVALADGTADLARAQHYCLDCRFRDWADVAGELTAVVRTEGNAERTITSEDGSFKVEGVPGDAVVVIRDAYGNHSAPISIPD